MADCIKRLRDKVETGTLNMQVGVDIERLATAYELLETLLPPDPTGARDLEMIQRRAAVGEEPYSSPSVDRSEAKDRDDVRPPRTCETDGHMFGPSNRCLFCKTSRTEVELTKEATLKIHVDTTEFDVLREREFYMECVVASLRCGQSSDTAVSRATHALAEYRREFGAQTGT
jgi:hypothetical protein